MGQACLSCDRVSSRPGEFNSHYFAVQAKRMHFFDIITHHKERLTGQQCRRSTHSPHESPCRAMPEKKHRDLQGPDASPADEGTRFIAAIDQVFSNRTSATGSSPASQEAFRRIHGPKLLATLAKRLQQHHLDPQQVEYGTFLATRMVLPSFRMLQSQRLDIETLGKTVPDETDQTTAALVILWLDGDDWILFHVDKDTGTAYMFDPTPRQEPSRVVTFFRQAYTDAGYGSITAKWRVPAGTRTDKWSSGWWVVEKVLMLVTGKDIKSIGFAVVKSEDVPPELVKRSY
ncbi:uncharacterized protein B0I36DRAFT_356882 [Microdochium trichocladiopsis]|uniref:Uncharacterized protein n=1 Tax=Microdochium trichocladiopsis TaxID=1682393 RepID=A0A9P8XP00_9PEZI|nr:uncharacterized protein B0I36DRAFT_356882 [Microdochium trichocladiopsis]KAH7007937.1 hypothetical protein B0I36DRAFT_356882 [Microdochium trichocladiopsis]